MSDAEKISHLNASLVQATVSCRSVVDTKSHLGKGSNQFYSPSSLRGFNFKCECVIGI